MINQNLSRWVRASINDHFKTDNTVKLFFDGDEWDATKAETSFAEIRINGPRFSEPSKGYTKVALEIGIMCSVIMAGDTYAYDRLVGIFQKKMTDIEVFKYGVGDDQSYLGCLRRVNDVDTIPYGQSEVNQRIILASVEGQYEMEL